MLQNTIKLLLVIVLFTCCALTTRAQTNTAGFTGLLSAIDSTHIKYPGEKIYLQFDKTAFLPGDTLWFKAWLFNASYLTTSAQSGILYIDIAGSDNKVIKQCRLLVQNGITWGNITLTKEVFTEGNYTLRAYTNWLRNFGDDKFFYKRFSIAGTAENNVLVNARTQLFTANNNDSVRTVLQFTGIDKQPLANTPLSLAVSTGRRPLFKSAVTTNNAGIADINFTLPVKQVQVTLTAENKASSQKIIIPVSLARPGNIDVQFMPEGGSLVAGLPAHVSFKAIGENGKSVDIKGEVVNSSNIRVATFQSLHKGMGAFYFLPADGETYTAKVTLANGIIKTYTLPAVKKEGAVLQVANHLQEDSLHIIINTTNGFLSTINNTLLLAQAGDVVCYAGVINFKDGNTINRALAKNIFPAGIARFTIITAEGQPLNQRLVFIANKDSLQLNIGLDKNVYYPRDSIAVTLTSTSDNAPVQGNFTLAVTDDAQARTDENSHTIVSQILLTNELKGYIEEPRYYFQQYDTTVWQALDNLLLTQGWAVYNWQPVFHPAPFTFEPEHDFIIKGRVSNIFNKGVRHTGIILLSRNPGFAIDTLTDDEGRFMFNNFPLLDTPSFIIQARNKKGRSFNVGVDVDVVNPPIFSSPPAPLTMPWYVNTDTTLLALATTKLELNKKLAEGTTLAPVIVYGKKMVQGSQNLNGNGNADVVLNEADMYKAGKQPLMDLLLANVKNFRIKSFAGTTFRWPYIGDQWVIFLYDGILLSNIYEFHTFEDLQGYLNNISAEDIKGIEVNTSSKNTIEYNRRFYPYAHPWDLAYIEITTHGGTGPVIQHTPGIYYYKSTPFNWPATFYSPRYSVKDTSDHSVDYRSTIYWQPNVVTGADGKATVNFYAADKPTTYTITIEGTDFNGTVAIKTKRVKIIPQVKN